MARKGRTYFHGRMAVLFKQGKTKNQVLQYYKKRYFPNNSLQEVEQILNKNRGINAFLLTKTQQKPKETFARFKKIGEIFRKAQTGRKHTKQTKKKIAEAQKKRYKASKERKKTSIAVSKGIARSEKRIKGKNVKPKKILSEEEKKINRSKGAKKRYRNPEERRKARERSLQLHVLKAIREAQTGKIESDETRKKKSKSAIRRFASGKERERQSKAVKRGMEKRAKMLNTISKSLAADQPTQEDRIIFEQTVSIIETEIGKFSRQEQRIIRMHFYENLTIPKISEKLGISETEIEKKMKKVFAKLAQNKKIKELR